MQHPAPQAPQGDGLKEAISSLKNSSLGYLQSKSELAAIEAKEAAEHAKKKISLGAVTAFFAIFTYALFLILAHSVLLKFTAPYLEKIGKVIPLDNHQIILLIFFVFHLLILLIYRCKLSKKPQGELFALTKSEIQKDKLWLKEMNNNAK